MDSLKFIELSKLATKHTLEIEEIIYWDKRYREHKRTAIRRTDRTGHKIQFLLSFEQWLGIWISSGQLNNRGLKKGQYVMSRVGDIGDYEMGNVIIKKTEENLSEAQKGITGGTSWNKGIECPDWLKQKLRDFHKGKPKTAEHSKKISEGKLGKTTKLKGFKRPVVVCPHCNKEGAINQMKRYHFDNCKMIQHKG